MKHDETAAWEDAAETGAPDEETLSQHLPKSFYDRPLTEEERAFAEAHLGLVRWFLVQRGLFFDEWFDIVIFRYLLSVKKWFALPQLQKMVGFPALACKAMQSALLHEGERARRLPKMISLNAPIGDEDDDCWGDVIAAPGTERL